MGGAMRGAAPMLLLPPALAADGQTEQSLVPQQSILIDPQKSAIAPVDDSQPGAGLSPEHAEEQARRMPVAERRDQNPDLSPAAPAGTAEAIARLQDTVARLEARPVDAWLERRLREFERGLAVLEARHGGRTGGEASIDDRLGVLRQSLEHLESRLSDRGRRKRAPSESTARCFRNAPSSKSCPTCTQTDRNWRSACQHWKPRRLLPNAAIRIARRSSTASGFATTPSCTRFRTMPLRMTRSKLRPTCPRRPISRRRGARRRLRPCARRTDAANPRKQSRMVFHAAAGSLVLFVAVLAGAAGLLRDQAMNVEPARAPARMVQPHLSHRASTPVSSIIVQNDSQARLRKSAEAGNTGAELLIALEYLNGSGVVRNDAGALSVAGTCRRKGAAACPVQSRNAFAKTAVASGQMRCRHFNGTGPRP